MRRRKATDPVRFVMKIDEVPLRDVRLVGLRQHIAMGAPLAETPIEHERLAAFYTAAGEIAHRALTLADRARRIYARRGAPPPELREVMRASSQRVAADLDELRRLLDKLPREEALSERAQAAKEVLAGAAEATRAVRELLRG